MSEMNRMGSVERRKRVNKQKKKNRALTVIAIVLIMIVAVGIELFFILRGGKNPLMGTWVYDEYTQYVFDKDGSGCLEVDDVRYAYTYTINGDTLALDFTENIVRDCEYTFKVEKGRLTLIGGVGTDGGTYQLNKK